MQAGDSEGTGNLEAYILLHFVKNKIVISSLQNDLDNINAIA